MKTCSHCKETKDYEFFGKALSSKDGFKYWCKSCIKISAQKPEHRKKMYEKRRLRGLSPEGRYSLFKREPSYRNLSFNLTFEDFMLFWQKPCFYCGDSIETIGLDRVNNNVGYEMGNLVSCCEMCNRMKLTHSFEDFIEKCRKITISFGGI